MNRRNFVRMLGAAACTILPSVLTDAVAKPTFDLAIGESFSGAMLVEKVADRVFVVKEMLDDIPGLTAFLKEKGLKLSGGDPDWESKTEIQVAEDGDDFIRDAKTIVLTYKKRIAYI